MYDELYEAWRGEKGAEDIQSLPRDFFAKLAEYIGKLKEESRMLDKRTLRGRLLSQERESVLRFTEELIRARYDKIMRLVSAGGIAPSTFFTEEEVDFYEKVAPSTESYLGILKNILQGRLLRVEKKAKKKVLVVRVLQEIPSIVGADMKTYGPFKQEDVAALPVENARILIKQGAAEEIEVT